MTTDTSDRIIRLKTVIAKTGLSRSMLYRRMAQGAFPRQISITDRCVGWRESAVDAWIADPRGYRPQV
jgi:prophage regulatory protein